MSEYIRNRRRSPRAPVRCLAIGAIPGGGVWASQTDDLGPRGCQVALPERIVPGGTIALTLSDDRLDEPLEVSGRIAWISTLPPWHAGVAFVTDDAHRAERWFERLVAAHPGLGPYQRGPERVPIASYVWPAEPPAPPAELRDEEVEILKALGAGCTAGELRARLGPRWPAAEGAFFTLLGRRVLTLSRAAAVPARVWAPILARYRVS